MKEDSTIATDIEVISKCPNCDSDDIREAFEGKDIFYRITDEKFVFSRCRHCGLYFLSKRPKPSAVGRFYPESYAPYRNLAADSRKRGNSIFAKILASPLIIFNKLVSIFTAPYLKNRMVEISEPKNADVILDFGCGDDSFLNKFKGRSRTIGMDFTETVIQKISKSGHIGVLYDGESAWDKIENNSVDFVRMNHVAEHLFNPDIVFKALHQKMKPGGVIHIAVPNPLGISSKLYEKYSWAFADVPRHILMYPKDVLTTILKRNGLDVVDVHQEFVTKDMLRSIYIKKHYDTLTVSSLSDVLNDTIKNHLLFLPMLLSSAFGMSDRYHLKAKKVK
jgi:SAM-dependent methyltransferase